MLPLASSAGSAAELAPSNRTSCFFASGRIWGSRPVSRVRGSDSVTGESLASGWPASEAFGLFRKGRAPIATAWARGALLAIRSSVKVPSEGTSSTVRGACFLIGGYLFLTGNGPKSSGNLASIVLLKLRFCREGLPACSRTLSPFRISGERPAIAGGAKLTIGLLLRISSERPAIAGGTKLTIGLLLRISSERPAVAGEPGLANRLPLRISGKGSAVAGEPGLACRRQEPHLPMPLERLPGLAAVQ